MMRRALGLARVPGRMAAIGEAGVAIGTQMSPTSIVVSNFTVL